MIVFFIIFSNKIFVKLEGLIQELKDLEKKLFKNEEDFRLVADYAYNWEYWIGLDEEYIYVSPSVEFHTGYLPEDFKENKELLKQIIDSSDWDRWSKHSHIKLENGEVEPLEFKIKTKNGEEKWIHHVCRTVYDSNGVSCGVRGSNRDITNEKILQEEIKNLRGILPICSNCKKIRNDEGSWEDVEMYISQNSDAEFSHGLCDDCAEKLYGNESWQQKSKQ